MRIYVEKASEQKYGGGHSFIHNFKKGMGEFITDNLDEADIYLIPSPTLAEREQVKEAKSKGKKIVLRLDNAVLNSRNRGTGMPRMRDFAREADLVIYQSKWAKGYLKPFTGKDGPVILNGTDLELFNAKGRIYRDIEKTIVYGYARFNRDESKNWNVARYEYSKIQSKQPQAELDIIGNFSQELIEYNFDFYNGERFKFWGVQPPEMMATLYKQIDVMIIPYYNDACSQTLIESLVSGCQIYKNWFLNTGGSPEILEKFAQEGAEGLGLERMCDVYKQELSKL